MVMASHDVAMEFFQVALPHGLMGFTSLFLLYFSGLTLVSVLRNFCPGTAS
jgi:hypothetical protein